MNALTKDDLVGYPATLEAVSASDQVASLPARIARFGTQRPDGEVKTGEWTRYADARGATPDAPEAPRVIIRSVISPEHAGLVGAEATLRAIDSNDSRGTFLVELTQEDWERCLPSSPAYNEVMAQWVYDVEDATHAALNEIVEGGVIDVPADKGEETGDALVDHARQQEREAFEARIATLETRLNEAQQRARDNACALEDFKTQVRDKAIEVAEEQRWCDDGLNEVLRELGLPEKAMPRRRFTVVIEVEMEADVDDDSESFIEGCLSVDSDGELSHDGDLENVDYLSSEIVRIKGIEDVD